MTCLEKQLVKENKNLRRLVKALDAYIDVTESFGDNHCHINEDEPECVALGKKLSAARKKVDIARRAVAAESEI